MSRFLLLLIIFFIHGSFLCISYAQNIGIGTNTPSQKLDVNGAIEIGGTTMNTPGAIRWNESKSDFEGYNGHAWVSLTGGKGKWGDQNTYCTENGSTSEVLMNTAYGLAYDLAAEGDWMVAGAPDEGIPNDPNQGAAGGIHIYHLEGDDWKSKYIKYDPDGHNSDHFGLSVGMSSTHVIAGAHNADLWIAPNIGKAYIYSYDASNCSLQATLLASDGQADDYFGTAVAIHGDYAVSGAKGKDVNAISDVGRAYVYSRSGSVWTENAKLNPPDGQMNDGFGSECAVWGDYIAVSTPYKTYNGMIYAGKAYVYKRSGNTWDLIAQLNSPVPKEKEYYGRRLFLRDNVLLVGAPEDNGYPTDGPGSVYVYQINNTTVTYEATLQASDGLHSDGLGIGASYYDGVIVAGAPNATVGGNKAEGKAYVFRKVNGLWQEEAILGSAQHEYQMYFGRSTAVTSTYAMIGGPYADTPFFPDNGRVFFYKRY